MEPDSEVFQKKIPKYLRRVAGRLNSESVGKQVGQSDVRVSNAAILNHNRAPCTRTKGKDNARDSKGARWKFQSVVNWTESRDNHGGNDNYHAQEVIENEGRLSK